MNAFGAWRRRQEERLRTTETDARREQAAIQETAAKLVMTRRKVEQLRAALVDRDRSQAEIGQATTDIIEQLGTALAGAELLEAIAADLGDLQLQALRVTR